MATAHLIRKNLDRPDEVRSFDKGRVEVVRLDGGGFGRGVLQPGWRWSECVKPIAGTESCRAEHLGYVVSGKLRVQMDGGEMLDFGPGDAMKIDPGHDAWVVGNEPCVLIEFSAHEHYGEKTEKKK
jgi:mannose-6-phosphate isomerase-like protein (cupin superfamily)